MTTASADDLKPGHLREGHHRQQSVQRYPCVAGRGRSPTPTAIFEKIAIRDVQDACDILSSLLYAETKTAATVT